LKKIVKKGEKEDLSHSRFNAEDYNMDDSTIRQINKNISDQIQLERNQSNSIKPQPKNK